MRVGGGLLLMLAVFVLGMVGVAKAWSDDIFFFTSFENVSEWKEMYERCEKPQDPVRHHISPVAFPSMDELHKPPPHLGKRVMHLYTKSPRSATNYFVSYTFPKDNECLYHKAYAPCYISRQVGFIRALVLRTEWESSRDLRDEFVLEEEEEYGSIITGERGANEKYFTAALFLGSATDEPNEFRSTHTIDGKGYPMEIYFFFVDEELTAAQKYVTLVVLVEESRTGQDNRWASPIVSAVKNRLMQKERQFLKDNRQTFQRERMFHHSNRRGCQNYPRSCTNPEDWSDIPSKEFKKYVDVQERWQQYLAYETNMKFDVERKEKLKGLIAEIKANLLHVKHVTEYFKSSFWLLPSLARVLGLDPTNFSYGGVDRSATANRMKDSFFQFQQYPNDAVKIVKDMEKTTVDPAVKAYVEWINNQDFGCTVSGNNRPNGRVEDFQRWKKLKHIYPRSREEILENLKKGPDAHPYVKVLWALNEAISNMHGVPHVLLQCLFSCSEEQWNVYDAEANITGKLVEEGVYLENAVQQIKELLIYKSAIKKIDREFYFMTRDAGQPDVETFLKKIEEVKKERMHHYDNLEEKGVKSDWKDPYDSYKYLRTEPIELGNLGLRKHDQVQYEQLDSPMERLHSRFQFSWLIPRGGGYYMYKGTLPVPPCYRTEMTYVFKEPIQMSKAQIKVLTTIPTAEKESINEDIKSTFAPLHKTQYYVPTIYKTNRSIPFEMYFEPRNHLTLGDDGHHDDSLKAAKDRRDKEAERLKELKDQLSGRSKKKSRSISSKGQPNCVSLLLIIPVVIFLKCFK